MRTLRPIFLIGFASCVFVFINPVIAAVLQVSTLFFFKKAQLRENQWLILGAIAIFGAVASYISFSISISTVSSWDTYALAVSQQTICNAVSISSTIILQFILIRSVFIAAGVQYTELQDDTDAKAKRVRDLAKKYEETRTDLTQRAEKAEHELDEVMLELARVNKSREELTNRAELAEQQLASSNTRSESLSQQLEESQKHFQNLSETFESEKQKLQGEIESLQMQLEDSNKQTSACQTTASDYESLSSRIENLLKENSELQDVASSYASRLFDAAQVNYRLASKVPERISYSEISSLERDLDYTKGQLIRAQNKISDLTSELKDARALAGSSQVALKPEYWQLFTKHLQTVFGIYLIQDLNHDLMALGLPIQQKPSNKSYVSTYKSSTQISLKALRETLKDAAGTIDAMKVDLSRLRGESAVKDQTIYSLQTQIKNLDSEEQHNQINEYKSEIETLNHKIDQLKEKLQEYAQQLQYFEDFKEAVIETFGASITGNLQVDIRTFSDLATGHQSSDAVPVEEFNELKRKLREKDIELSQLQKHLQELESQLEQSSVSGETQEYQSSQEHFEQSKFREKAKNQEFVISSVAGDF